LIGKDKVELTLEDLGQLQAPGQTYERSVNLKAGCDFTTNENCDTSGGPHYRLRYQVKRVADDTGAPVDPNP
jgi:hypothetical protein